MSHSSLFEKGEFKPGDRIYVIAGVDIKRVYGDISVTGTVRELIEIFLPDDFIIKFDRCGKMDSFVSYDYRIHLVSRKKKNS